MDVRRHARLLVAAVFATGALVEALAIEDRHVALVATTGALLAAAAGLPAAWMVVAAQCAVMGATGLLEVEPAGGLFFGLSLLAGAGWASASLGRRGAVLAFVSYAAATAFSVALVGKPEDTAWAIGVFLVPPFVAGRLLRARHQRLTELERLTSELSEQRERTAALAAEVERARIARDIRAVLAAGLSDMTARADAAAAAPAPQAFADLHATGTATAAELRRLLRLLH